MDNKLILIIAAVILPPLAIFLKEGIGKTLIINCVLTLCFFVPGMVHSLYVVTK